MKKRIIFILLIINVISSLLMATVFAWFTIENGGSEYEYNTYFNSRRLMETDMTAIVYRGTSGNYTAHEVDYNASDYYNSSTYSLKIGAISSNTENAPHPLNIDLHIKPYMDLYLRVFLIETWKNSSGDIINPPVQLSYVSDDDFSYDLTTGAFEYDNIIHMNDNFITLDFLSGIRTPNGAAVPDNYSFEVAVYIESKQANASDTWELNEHTINTDAITNINMIFEKITNPYYLRGVGVKLIHGDDPNNTRTFIYNENNKNRLISDFGISNNPHKVIIYLPTTTDFTINNNNATLSIVTKYRNIDHFVGVHDFVFSPNVINSYQNGTYHEGNIVFYNGNYYIKINGSATNTAPTNSWHWRLLGSIYVSGTSYPEGSVVYFELTGEYFEKINGAGSTSLTGESSWHWARVSREFVSGITYPVGALVEYDGYVYEKVQSGTTGNPSISWHWKRMSTQINHENNNNYNANEIVYNSNNGNYYRALQLTNSNLPSGTSSNQYWQYLPIITSWNSANNYNQYNLIVINEIPYVWLGANGSNSQTAPGTENNGWQRVSRYWYEYNRYQPGQHVYYNNRIYTYRGTPNSNSTPGNNDDWEIFGIEWSINTTYVPGSIVIHNGSVWRAIATPGVIPPGQDFTIWEEIRMNWLPDRDVPPTT